MAAGMKETRGIGPIIRFIKKHKQMRYIKTEYVRILKK